MQSSRLLQKQEVCALIRMLMNRIPIFSRRPQGAPYPPIDGGGGNYNRLSPKFYKNSPIFLTSEKVLINRAYEHSRRAFVQSLKNKPCADCNKSYPHYVMDFDHVTGKTFTLSSPGRRSNKTILKEVEKCELVCSNCHRIRTFERRNV